MFPLTRIINTRFAFLEWNVPAITKVEFFFEIMPAFWLFQVASDTKINKVDFILRSPNFCMILQCL